MENLMHMETIADIDNRYHLWNRDVRTLRYQMNRAALHGEWDVILTMFQGMIMDDYQYDDMVRYISDIAYVFDIPNLTMNLYDITGSIYPSTYEESTDINNLLRDSIITWKSIDIIRRECISYAYVIPIDDTSINPVVIEHTYQWWSRYDVDDLLNDPDVSISRKLSITYGESGMNR